MGKKSLQGASRIENQEPKIVENVPADDDEEITEDEAFNSDDERIYGHLFGPDNEGEETDGSDGSGEDDDNDGGKYMLELLDKAGQVERSEESTLTNCKGKLTLGNLMEGLNDTQGYNELRKALSKKQKTVSAPVGKKYIHQEQRNLAYTEQVKNLSRWTEVIQDNRQSETLDFKPKTRVEATKDSLVTIFEPKSDFESDLQEALEQAGQEDQDAVLREEERALHDDLGSNRLSMEEYKKRRSQLAQVRALMFYHEQKRHHIKKIKSKKYRRIRKKQRQHRQDLILEAAMDEDESLVSEMRQKEEISRIQERMTLAHKNTSKWAKRILKRGKNVDLETRKALSAQLKRGDDLRRKMTDNDDQSATGGDSSGEDLVTSTKKIIADIQSKDVDGDDKHGLLKLSFMQKGIQKQRDLAKEEARKLLTELRSHGAREPKGPLVDATTKESVASSKQLEKHLTTGELVAKSREFGVSNSLASRGPIKAIQDEELGMRRSYRDGSTSRQENEAAPGVRERDFGKTSKARPENPWIGSAEYGGTSSIAQTQNDRKESGVKGSQQVLDLDAIVSNFDEGSGGIHASKSSKPSEAQEGRIATLNQDELVRRAFATTATKEVTAEFEREIEETVTHKSRKMADLKTSSGWGSWAGVGAPPPPRQASLGTDTASAQKDSNPGGKRRAKAKPDVVINKKRLKKASDVFMLGELPHPYSSRQEYEQVMLGGLGKEWNVTSAYRNMTRPEILTRAGQSIRPISKSGKVKRAAAKF